jgi:hypothetical protein
VVISGVGQIARSETSVDGNGDSDRDAPAGLDTLQQAFGPAGCGTSLSDRKL